jgi:hypothetical protein
MRVPLQVESIRPIGLFLANESDIRSPKNKHSAENPGTFAAIQNIELVAAEFLFIYFFETDFHLEHSNL